MSVVKKCEYEKCQKNAKSVCDCKSKNLYCAKHLISHISKIGMHPVASIFVEIDEQDKGKILKDIDRQVNGLIEIRNEAGKFCSEMIANLTKNLRNLTNQVSKCVNNYRALKRKIILKGRMQQGELKEIQVERGKKSFGGLLKKNESEDTQIFENALKTTIGREQGADDTCLFGLCSNKLIKVDFDSLRQTEFALQYPAQYCYSCKLSDGSYFIFSQGSNACYIADVAIPKITQIENGPNLTGWGLMVACIDNAVYAIASNGQKVNHKYDRTTEKWSKFADNPLPNANVYGDALHGKICLTSDQSGNTFLYNPVNDNYVPALVIPEGSPKHVGHGFILSTTNCFKMEDCDSNNWKAYRYSAKSEHCCGCMFNSRLFKKDKYLYFFRCGPGTILRFDTELFTYQRVKG